LDQPAESFAHLRSFLSDDEVRRGDRFVQPIHRDRFVAARGILRAILGRLLARSPASLTFDYSSTGQPRLSGSSDDDPGVRFSVSHSGDMALYGITLGRQVGVDLEVLRSIPDAAALAGRFFSAAEQAALQALPDAARDTAFLACWTRKEAYLKAVGVGIGSGLDGVEVDFASGQPGAFALIGGQIEAAARWTVEAVSPAAGFIGALVCEGRDLRITTQEWPAPQHV